MKTVSEVLQNAATGAGDGAAIYIAGMGSLVLQVSGTFVGTVTFEGSVDGTTWNGLRGLDLSRGITGGTASQGGLWQFQAAGLVYVRARVSAFTSGEITVRGFGSASAGAWSGATDGISRALMTIDYAHHEIHGGSFFHAFYSEDVANGGLATVGLITPNTTKWVHLVGAVGHELEAVIAFYEGATFSGGTALTVFNRNRNSSTSAGMTLVHTPTVTDVGTLITESHDGSGRNAGGERREGSEWVLKQNTKYILRLTNASNANNYASFLLDWYEHTNLA